MCGIAGFVDYSGKLGDSTLRKMTATLHYRGPDDRGHLLVSSGNAELGLGHTRLSIQDLSENGHQPMGFGPFSIVFNGEIYNFREIRSDLEAQGHGFSTECDTEVILHAFAEWGIACLNRFIGMFAFVLHDASKDRLYLARDRVGVKPLYVHTGSDFWLFGSELKALRECPEFPAKLSLPDLHSFFRHGHVPDDGCIYKDCHKVDAGEYWVLEMKSRTHRKVQWWDQTELYEQPRSTMSFEEASYELERLLYSACQYRMVSDVPVGVFLSGGYDSTAVAAMLQSQASSPIKTFTIGFSEGNDEAPFARETAGILGTDHHELYCSPREAMEVVPSLPEVYDEPFADSSGIPTLLVSRMARSSVKVALSADGGDELFCGYKSYPETLRRARRLSHIPRPLRAQLGGLLSKSAHSLPSTAHAGRHKLDALGHCLVKDDALMAQRLHGHSRLMPRSLVDSLLPGGSNCRIEFTDRPWPEGTHPIEAAMGLDYQTYLKDDILTKVDRATMSVGLEGREPLLDHRLAEFAARIPLAYKYDGITAKRILRDVVHRHVPQEKMSRPKSGFSLPIMAWLRGELRGLLEDVCSESALAESGAIDVPTARHWLSEFEARRFHYTPLIWRLFVFQSWARRWL